MRLLERFNKARFDWEVRSILKSGPVLPGDSDFIVLSMVQHRDVLAYLLALKSFALRIRPSMVVVVADPTLSRDDRALIRSHVPQIAFREAAEFHDSRIPVGGTWERLAAIAEYAKHAYVVQLDADTVAVNSLAAVRDNIQKGAAFTLSTEDDMQIQSSAAVAEWAKPRVKGQAHIQLLAESNLDRLDSDGRFKYARGCSGFAGFSKGSFNIATMADISQKMAELIGSRWSDWGTEQFTSNLIVCSTPGAKLLPHPAYCNAGRVTSDTVFLHFIGYVRYINGLYPRTARAVCRELQQARQ